MLVLTKGITSNIVVTLTEKQLLTSPNYLFIFNFAQTNQNKSYR